jgi:hypothetical protein
MIRPLVCKLFWLMASVLMLGCSRENPVDVVTNHDEASSPASIVAGELPTSEEQEKMLSAKEQLFAKLSSRLTEAMSDQGPVAAISVCQQEAPKFAAEVCEAAGVKIGRTGVRLRNSDNVAPTWAATLIADKVASPTFARLDNGNAAALLPIKLQSQCLMCHGSTEQISPEIANQLTKLYPNDQATGFVEGELRGWFWIELPRR